MVIQIIGLGYIGLPTMALISSKNIKVHGVDINSEVVNNINNGKIHIQEPGVEELILKAHEQKLISASLRPKPADVHVIVVPTPFKNNFEPDISYVISAADSLKDILKEGDLIVIESTSPVGTTEKVKNFIYNERKDIGGKLNFAYCPERILPGNALYELSKNDRAIGGIDIQSSELAKKFYQKFVDGNLYLTNSRTAELCKLTENSSRDIQIAFANELSMICESADIDVRELINLANKHPRVNILSPGVGVGGHCIAVDPYFIISDFPNESKIIAMARDVNNSKTNWCIKLIKNSIENFNSNNKKKPNVSLLGLAFKPNIDDLRESPALHIAKQIIEFKYAEYYVVEPNINSHPHFKIIELNEAIKKSDIIVVLVGHKEFKSINITEKKIIDFTGITK